MDTGLSNREKLLVGVTLLSLAVLVCVSLRASSLKEIELVQRERISVSLSKIKVYEFRIGVLEGRIDKIQLERDSIQQIRNQIHVKTIHIIDSVYALPFEGKSEFFSAEVTRIDSIRGRYLSSDN
jgi:hypothetical protein